MGVCGNVCCVAAVVKDNGFLSIGVLYVCVRDMMDVVFSICIVSSQCCVLQFVTAGQ